MTAPLVLAAPVAPVATTLVAAYGVPILIGGLVLVAAFRGDTKPKFEMTAQRRVIFDTLMKECRDPNRLREVAQAFRTCGGDDPWAILLEKRAALRERPKEIRDAHREVFRKALICKDADSVDIVAKSFEQMGATGCAAQLYAVAKGLRGATLVAGEYGFPQGKKRRNRLKRAVTVSEEKQPTPQTEESTPAVQAEVVT